MISNSGTTSLGLYDFKRQLDSFGGVVNISCSILEMVNKATAVNIPDFALVSNGGII